jgi:hypothetical protein
MPVRRRIDKRREPLTDEQEAFLHSDDEGAGFFKYVAEEELKTLWDVHRDRVIQEHVTAVPGDRPERWWQYDAPEPRQRLGGTGTPAADVLAYVPTFRLGIPSIWVSARDVSFYNGRGRDVNNQPIGQHSGQDFLGVAIDPMDPPTYEAQATYLKRLDLLLRGEARRSDYSPTVVVE